MEGRASGVLFWVAKFQKPIGHLSGDDRQATDYPSLEEVEGRDQRFQFESHQC